MEPNTHTTSLDQINQIISAVEQTFGLSPKTPKDFDLLRLSIYERTATLLSPTTLKRLWGYLGEKVIPRRHTLDTLCRYAGWANLNAIYTASPHSESGPLSLQRIDLSGNQLLIGSQLTIAWLPDREIHLQYLGNSHFKIISAINTRLQPLDTFTTAIIAQNQPLYLDNLTRQGQNLGIYVCGRHSGIRFILQPQKDQ